MRRPKKRSLPGRALVVLAVWTALILTYRHIRETDILSRHHFAERTAAAAKMVADIDIGNWPKALLDRLAGMEHPEQIDVQHPGPAIRIRQCITAAADAGIVHQK